MIQNLRSAFGTLRGALKPNGRVFFVDGLREPTSTARDHDPPTDAGVVRRRLNDGREFDVVKVFYKPATLERRLLSRGWNGFVRSSGKFFLYGSVTLTPRSRARAASTATPVPAEPRR